MIIPKSIPISDYPSVSISSDVGSNERKTPPGDYFSHDRTLPLDLCNGEERVGILAPGSYAESSVSSMAPGLLAIQRCGHPWLVSSKDGEVPSTTPFLDLLRCSAGSSFLDPPFCSAGSSPINSWAKIIDKLIVLGGDDPCQRLCSFIQHHRRCVYGDPTFSTWAEEVYSHLTQSITVSEEEAERARRKKSTRKPRKFGSIRDTSPLHGEVSGFDLSGRLPSPSSNSVPPFLIWRNAFQGFDSPLDAFGIQPSVIESDITTW